MAADLTSTTTWELPNSPHTPKTRIPCLGFGVYKAVGGRSSILTALAAGYRQLDTAQMYENEDEVGHAVLSSGLSRSELFITTKILDPKIGGVGETLESLRESVRKCSGSKGKWEGGDGYVDLFLIHGPRCGPSGRKVLWQALEKLREEGGTREIGVSNYGIKHLQELFAYAKHPPVVNQLELHPFCQHPDLSTFCSKHHILLQAYSPLVRARKMDNPAISGIAKAHHVTPAQVLVRWNLQRGWIPLPKSDDPERIKTNKDVFGWLLTEKEMEELNQLGVGLENGEGAVCPYVVNLP